MKRTKPGKNEFFDINKLPPEKGLLLFGLSMNKLDNRQNAKNCAIDAHPFAIEKMSKPLTGLNFIYGDFLYLYSDEPAPVLKERYMNQVIQHTNATQKIIEKNPVEFQIQHAFNYMVWNQLYVGTKNFHQIFIKIKKIFEQDKKFQDYLKQDSLLFNKKATEIQTNFILEESLMFYLLTHNQIKLPNDYIQNQQKWILFCYPGRPLKSTVYLYQLNPFKLEWSENPYQKAWYDLESKKLIKYGDIDLETYSVK
jgi:hypothetical protein